MKVLVTGASGQLGQELIGYAEKLSELEVIGLTREELDVTDDEQVMEVVQKHQPDAIIHAAAYTAVDLAESERELAYEVNALGASFVAEAAEEIGAKCCLISTDYVFNGEQQAPYKESDTLDPVNWYGFTKQAGERFVEQLSTRYFIVRTSWVYGLYGNNFLKTMLKLGASKPLKVVDDQFGSPTYTEDLAAFLLKLISTEKYGVYHATNSGSCSWYEFAQAIFAEHGIEVDLSPCSSAEYPTEAKRPTYSVLGSQALEQNGFGQLRHWREGLKACLTRMQSE